MSDETSSNASSDSPAEVCSAAEALKRAKAEFEKAQACYEHVCHEASERLKSVRAKRVGEVIDGTLEAVKRRPAPAWQWPHWWDFPWGDCSAGKRTAMRARLVDDDLLRSKRELRLRIGRSRRRIDSRLRATRNHAGQLCSWRTYVVRYPGWALVAAFGAGFAASAGFKPGRASRWLGLASVTRMGRVPATVWGRTESRFGPDERPR